jgi:hypothetical protein
VTPEEATAPNDSGRSVAESPAKEATVEEAVDDDGMDMPETMDEDGDVMPAILKVVPSMMKEATEEGAAVAEDNERAFSLTTLSPLQPLSSLSKSVAALSASADEPPPALACIPPHAVYAATVAPSSSPKRVSRRIHSAQGGHLIPASAVSERILTTSCGRGLALCVVACVEIVEITPGLRCMQTRRRPRRWRC